MPSRRRFLTTIGTAASASLAGCLGGIRDYFESDTTVEGPCDDSPTTWPTAGGDSGRTGHTDTSPPAPDADAVDLLAGIHKDGQQELAAALPVVADGTAYVPVASGLIAVDLQSPIDGARWKYDLDEQVDAVPLITCGVAFVPGLNRLDALDQGTGDRYWRVTAGSREATSVAAHDETVFLAGSSLIAIDMRTGDRLWSANGGDTLALDNAGVYTTENANGTGDIYGHDLDGEQRWHLSLGKIVGSASVQDGTVWVADNRGTVYAIDAHSGETVWSRSLDGVEKIHSGLAVDGDDVVVPAGMGSTSFVLDAATGVTRWKKNTGIVTGRPLIGDDWIALGRTNTGITLYDRETGDQRTTWSREEYGLGTIDGLVAVEDGFVVRGGTTSGLTLVR
ncbi:outer membrane protein assembly factor BamB family protein [Halobacterium noricense]|uniref:outer membrane protein assembly factor BamB family protein n=1 Tax=Halobacterium noricense TaxID=223182 RepID=UPI001E5B4FEE|nr:PQQ-binding-like beta-propeller repeat protein [Halobacterium noricense]UHH26945.1 PQQ-like beta-propeller repeat protein [Halobacterium noricense]